MALPDYTPLSSPSSPHWGGWNGGAAIWPAATFSATSASASGTVMMAQPLASRTVETESGLQHGPERPFQFFEQPEHVYPLSVVTVPSSHGHGHVTPFDHSIAHAIPVLLAMLVPLLAFAWKRSAVARPWRTLRPRAP